MDGRMVGFPPFFSIIKFSTLVDGSCTDESFCVVNSHTQKSEVKTTTLDYLSETNTSDYLFTLPFLLLLKLFSYLKVGICNFSHVFFFLFFFFFSPSFSYCFYFDFTCQNQVLHLNRIEYLATPFELP